MFFLNAANSVTFFSKKRRTDNVLCERPRCYHRARKTRPIERIFKLTQIHAPVIYQNRCIRWIRWISLPFREKSIVLIATQREYKTVLTALPALNPLSLYSARSLWEVVSQKDQFLKWVYSYCPFWLLTREEVLNRKHCGSCRIQFTYEDRDVLSKFGQLNRVNM